MREYDEDYARPYRPFLRRIIILVVVITAVPVMLWTITAFVRSYVAQPKAPTFRPMAAATLAEPPDSAAAATGTINSPASATEQPNLPDAGRVVEARATATDARSQIVLIRKPAADQPTDAHASAPAGGAQVTSAAPAQRTAAAMQTAAMPAAPMTIPQPIAPPVIATPAGADNTNVWPDPPKFGNGPLAAAPPPPVTD